MTWPYYLFLVGLSCKCPSLHVLQYADGDEILFGSVVSYESSGRVVDQTEKEKNTTAIVESECILQNYVC